MNNPEAEQMTDADWLIVMLLTKAGDPYVGPIAWLCRLAWFSYSFDQPFDPDAVIADQADYLNQPDQATNRTNLIGCFDWLKKTAAKRPTWQLPDNAFDPSKWLSDAGPTLTYHRWLPGDPEPTNG